MSGMWRTNSPGRKRAMRLREQGRDTTETFCDEVGQPDSCCNCSACVAYFAAQDRYSVTSTDLSRASV